MSRIAVLLYPEMTALDAIGPYETLALLPGSEVKLVARDPGPISTDNGPLELIAAEPLSAVPDPDVVVVPGGAGTRAEMERSETIDWLRGAHQGTTWTTSVCTGALLLGAAGILEGLEATTHWMFRDWLPRFGATPVPDRVVESGKVITAAGVSSGIDMALLLVERLAGPQVSQAIQLGIEYDPQPPHDAGSPEKAPTEVVEGVRSLMAESARVPG
jgi:transcriptional regulator GlxA family with amidase domain